MLGKLLKYDLRAMFKQLGFIWPTALALALVNRFTLSGLTSASTVGETAAGIAMAVYVAVLVAMFIVALVFVIQRFYKGLLGNEGYLMHTLPVRSWQLVTSKLLTAAAATLINGVVAILSILLMIPWTMEELRRLPQFFSYVHENMDGFLGSTALMMTEMAALLLFGCVLTYLHLYLAMAIGHLFSRNRIPMSVAAYLGINVADRLVTNHLFPPRLSTNFEGIFSAVTGELNLAPVHSAVLQMSLRMLPLAIVCFAGTVVILDRKLNLE